MLAAKLEANARIYETQRELDFADDQKLPFLCECADVRCRQLILLTSGEYRAVRSVSGRSAVADGHPSSGRIVERRERYVIVED
jgi:hypothetical protein